MDENVWDMDVTESIRLTLGELDGIARTPIKAMSARDGRILANPYNKNNPKHAKIAGYTVVYVWADAIVRRNEFTPHLMLGLSVYIREE